MKPAFPPGRNPNHLTDRITQLRSDLAALLLHTGPHLMARRTGSTHETTGSSSGVFLLPLWGNDTVLSYPAWQAIDSKTGHSLPDFSLALVLYYFLTADGSPIDQGWISFSQLPDGRFYNQAFQGYTGGELQRAFHNGLLRLDKVARAVGGAPVPPKEGIPGNFAWTFQAFPRVRLMLAGWEGDDEFPASYQFLFDASAPHYLPTDVYALLGSLVTRKLIAESVV